MSANNYTKSPVLGEAIEGRSDMFLPSFCVSGLADEVGHQRLDA